MGEKTVDGIIVKVIWIYTYCIGTELHKGMCSNVCNHKHYCNCYTFTVHCYCTQYTKGMHLCTF